MSSTPNEQDTRAANRILTLSTIAFTLMFAVWLMFGILAIPVQEEFGLTKLQFFWLTAIAVLNGSMWRLAFGILTDRVGGRRVFTALLLITAIPAFLIPYATTYTQLMLLAFLVGVAGNAFSVGIAWNSAWFPKQRQGTALGVFGAGNVGASVTKLIGPAIIVLVPIGGLVPGGWRFIPFTYGILLIGMAAIIWCCTPTQDRMPGRGRPLAQMLLPLKRVRVWRLSLYYVVVFGAYVALALVLPQYYREVYGVSLGVAAGLTALFIFPASLLRPLGGYLSDKYGARRVMYWVFGSMTIATLLLAIPNVTIATHGTNPSSLSFRLNVWGFTALIFLVGVAMGVGKAAVYKYIPEYFPKDVGAVGGLVGLLGALGGFFLPLAFGYLQAWTHIPQITFGVLFLITLVSFAWLHITVLGLRRACHGPSIAIPSNSPVLGAQLHIHSPASGTMAVATVTGAKR